MTRSLTSVKIEEDKVRYRVVVRDSPSQPGTDESFKRRIRFLQALAEQPALLQCGPAEFDRVAIEHDGAAWVAEATAVVEERR